MKDRQIIKNFRWTSAETSDEKRDFENKLSQKRFGNLYRNYDATVKILAVLMLVKDVGGKHFWMLAKNLHVVIFTDIQKSFHQHTFTFLSSPTYSLKIQKILNQHTFFTKIFHQHHFSQNAESGTLTQTPNPNKGV